MEKDLRTSAANLSVTRGINATVTNDVEFRDLEVSRMWRAFFECLDRLRNEEREAFLESTKSLFAPGARSIALPKVSLSGHTRQVNRVAFSPNGNTLASVSADTTVRLWDAQSGDLRAQRDTIVGDKYKEITSVDISPDGSLMLLGHHANNPTLWEVNTLQKRTELSGHEGFVPEAIFSPDGRLMASASLDLTSRIWAVDTGESLATLSGHKATPSNVGVGVWSVAFSPDGKMLATGGSDKTVRLWEVESGEQLIALEGHDLLVFSVRFSPDGKTLASSSQDATIKLWNVEMGKERSTLHGHADWVVGVAYSSDGKHLASASWDKSVNLWDAETGQLKRSYQHPTKVHCVAVSPDSRLVASGCDDGTVKLWEI